MTKKEQIVQTIREAGIVSYIGYVTLCITICIAFYYPAAVSLYVSFYIIFLGVAYATFLKVLGVMKQAVEAIPDFA